MNESSVIRANIHEAYSKLLPGVISALVGGALGGLVAGIAARVAMRAVALMAGMGASFSVGGTLFILLFGVFLGALGGLLFGLVQPLLPGATLTKAKLYGLLLSSPVVIGGLLIERRGELTLISREAFVLLFGPIPVLYGLIVAWILGRLDPGMALKA